MPLELRSGSAQVMYSGIVTTFGGQPLELQFPVRDIQFTLQMVFKKDPDTEALRVDSKVLEHGLCLELVNFEDAQGRGSAVPVLLGEAGEQLVFLHFRVFRYGRTADYTVHYTLYCANKEDVDWRPLVGRESKG